jgi:hypothetical protein
MKEASLIESGTQLIQLFSIILLYCEVTKPFELFDEFKSNMAESILYTFRAKPWSKKESNFSI